MNLLEEFESQTPAEYKIRSEEALRWYRQQMRAVRINAREFYRTSGLRKTRRILSGRFYTYYYEPKYHINNPKTPTPQTPFNMKNYYRKY